MQILRFEFSDLSDCPAEKGGMVLANDCNVTYCNVTLCLTQQSIAPHILLRAVWGRGATANRSKHDYKLVINKQLIQ